MNFSIHRFFYLSLLILLLPNWLFSEVFFQTQVLFPTWFFRIPYLGAFGFFVLIGASASLGSAFHNPQSRLFRVCAALSLTLWGLYSNSFGKIGHFWVSAIFVSWIFAICSERKNQQILYAQIFILFTYFLAGVSKFTEAGRALVQGRQSFFYLDSFARLLMRRNLQLGIETTGSRLLLEHAWIGWLGFWTTAILEVLFLFIFIYRRSSGALIASLLISFHLSAYFLLKADFTTTVVLLMIFFLAGSVTAQTERP